MTPGPRERDLEEFEAWDEDSEEDELSEDELSEGESSEDDFASPVATRPRRPRSPRVESLFRDDHFEAIDKPAGLATVSERWRPNAPTVIDELWKLWKKTDRDVDRPRVVHRLDRGTTGVLLFARTRDAQVNLREQFRERTVRKTYCALVTGIPRESTGTIEIEIGEDARHLGKMRLARKGKACVTDYEVVDTFRDLSWIRLTPHQGRTHQIRVSLLSIGHPCAVDDLYGSPEPIRLAKYKRRYRTGRGRPERPLLDRLGLHAATLELDHPLTGERMTIEAPLPKDLAATLKQLDRWARE